MLGEGGCIYSRGLNLYIRSQPRFDVGLKKSSWQQNTTITYEACFNIRDTSIGGFQRLGEVGADFGIHDMGKETPLHDAFSESDAIVFMLSFRYWF